MRDLLNDDDVPADSLSRVWVDTRQTTAAFRALDLLLTLKCTAHSAYGLALLGPARLGKTSVPAEYLRRRKEAGQELKYLYVELKPNTKPTSIAYETLCSMDDPDPSYGNSAARTTRVNDFIKSGKYDLIIYDEAHYLVDSTTQRVQADGVGWIVGLLNECRTPLLLVGYEKVEDVIERNESLDGRLLPLETFRALDHADPEDLEEFRHILRNLEMQLGFPTASNLAERDLAARICYLCLGRLGYLEVFLTSARELARGRQHSCLMLEDLRDTAAVIGRKWNKRPFNPFAVDDLQKAIASSKQVPGATDKGSKR